MIPVQLKYLLLLFFAVVSGLVSQEMKIGDESDGSRAIPVHLIRLIDQDSSVIRPGEQPLLPFSTEKTCGTCHDYATIRSGWHFNAGDSATADGRPGQPWIYVDAHSATQIPLSLRDWPGTFKPAQIGMDNLEFITEFGRHMPGGSVGDNEERQAEENYMRWMVTGKLEINCLSCHDAEKMHNQVEFASQVSKQGFRWAATASAGFAMVEGSAEDLPVNYDIYAGFIPGQSQKMPPQVTYDVHRFNRKNEVFFDIVRAVPNERCYFCHSTKWIDKDNTVRWHMQEDVHIKSGMLCVDCHRNGLDHNMVRGYRNEPLQVASFSCSGCHMSVGEKSGQPLNGRLGAPVPRHEGLPPVHFEKLACTACHSGNWPEDKNIFAKTSMAHRLGLHNSNKNDQALPHIITPVYTRDEDGKYAPHNLIWPSFWAEMDSNRIKPIEMDVFLPIARKIIAHVDSLGTYNWPQIEDSTLVSVLDSLYRSGRIDHPPVYISAGKVFFLNRQGQLAHKEHEAAEPYMWPVAHDVRPAAQALGINGCNDCHSPASNFAFGDIIIDSPLKGVKETIAMNVFLEQNIVYENMFAATFYLRPVFKYVLATAWLLLMAVLLIYGFKGLRRLLEFVSGDGISGSKT